MDNAFVKMVIMMIIKIIVYASNVQHFGKLATQLFFKSTVCSYNSLDNPKL